MNSKITNSEELQAFIRLLRNELDKETDEVFIMRVCVDGSGSCMIQHGMEPYEEGNPFNSELHDEASFAYGDNGGLTIY